MSTCDCCGCLSEETYPVFIVGRFYAVCSDDCAETLRVQKNDPEAG